jgi:ABC-type sugar transport system ATPase subunit
MAGIEISSLVKRYGKTQVVHGIDLTSKTASSSSSSALPAAASRRRCA